jgi:hypothetical protein
MTIIDRRAMLKSLLGATVVAATGSVLVPDQANSAPLPLATSDVVMPVSPVEKAVFVSRRRRPRSRRRTICSYHHGKKVCSTHS